MYVKGEVRSRGRSEEPVNGEHFKSREEIDVHSRVSTEVTTGRPTGEPLIHDEFTVGLKMIHEVAWKLGTLLC